MSRHSYNLSFLLTTANGLFYTSVSHKPEKNNSKLVGVWGRLHGIVLEVPGTHRHSRSGGPSFLPPRGTIWRRQSVPFAGIAILSFVSIII